MQLRAIDTKGLFFPPGEMIAERFKLEERIGQGPFGQIYRAQDTLIDAEVALKIFDPEVLQTPLDEERFTKATRSARALTQRNVVRLHDSGVHKDHPWVSMQYLEGLDLRRVARLRQEKGENFSPEELEPILAQITLALQHIGRDFPHCDLKPENILFLPSLLKITDSYLFAALPAAVFSERAAESPFLAPELRSPGAGAGPRCDVYSVGALIGYMLFGEGYEPGDMAQAPAPLGSIDALCQRAMAQDPADRYESVEALNEDFTSILDTGRMLAQRPPVEPPMAPSVEGARAISAPSALPGPSMDPPTPPAPPPATRGSAQEVDPLDVETAPDIGMPLEDDLATTEFRRDAHGPELGDLLPTNEVDRDRFPGVTKPKRKERPTEKPVKTSETVAKKALQEESQKEIESESSRKVTPIKAPQAAPKKEGRGLAPMIVMGLIIVALLALLIGSLARKDGEAPTVASSSASEDDEVVVAEETEVASADEDDQGGTEDTGMATAEAIQAASTPTSRALARAEEAAKARAEELAEEERRAEEEEAAAAEVALASAEESIPAPAATGAAGRPDGASPGAARPTTPAPATKPAPAPTPRAPAPQPARQAAQGTKCPSGMVLVKAGGSNVCVDIYEYPGSGRAPKNNASWFEARRICQQQDKRLCSLSEWRAACGSYYPYGRNYNPDRCNTADADGFERSLQPAGAASQCRSPSGAYDMSGNVYEWVEEQRVAGGGYDSEADQASCRYSSPKAPASTSPNVGFRCCADPE